MIKSQGEEYLLAVEHLVPLKLECEEIGSDDSLVGDASDSVAETSSREISPDMTTLSHPETTVDAGMSSPEQSLLQQREADSRPIRQAALR